jgi:hypothetical protein
MTLYLDRELVHAEQSIARRPISDRAEHERNDTCQSPFAQCPRARATAYGPVSNGHG